jgi:hypothetical protein
LVLSLIGLISGFARAFSLLLWCRFGVKAATARGAFFSCWI